MRYGEIFCKREKGGKGNEGKRRGGKLKGKVTGRYSYTKKEGGKEKGNDEVKKGKRKNKYRR